MSSRLDIWAASPKTKMIAIADLPIQYYPLLAKFQGLTRIQFSKGGRSGASDAKLEAIAALSFQYLRDIDLNCATGITVKGIAALSKLPPLKELALRGSSVDDAALAVMGTRMRLSRVNVEECGAVTVEGLKGSLEVRHVGRSWLLSRGALANGGP